MSDQSKTLTIVLTDRAPVRISDDNWPLIARGSHEWHDGQHRSQANRTKSIYVHVRQHADGRKIVYARYSYTSAYQGEPNSRHQTGELLAADAGVIEAIQRVATDLESRAGNDRDPDIRACMNDCIADLPPTDL